MEYTEIGTSVVDIFMLKPLAGKSILWYPSENILWWKKENLITFGGDSIGRRIGLWIQSH